MDSTKTTEPVRCICGSDRVMPGVEILGAAAVVYRKPGWWAELWSSQMTQSELRATICGDCGRVDLVAERPQELWEAYLARQGNLRSG